MTTISAPPAAPVPLLDLKKQYATLKDEILRVTAEVYESQGFILGPRVEAFEKAVAAYVGAKHAVADSAAAHAAPAAMAKAFHAIRDRIRRQANRVSASQGLGQLARNGRARC